jgi:hypothetical protein
MTVAIPPAKETLSLRLTHREGFLSILQTGATLSAALEAIGDLPRHAAGVLPPQNIREGGRGKTGIKISEGSSFFRKDRSRTRFFASS